METRSLPETIRTIIAQAGGLGLAGAFKHVGTSQFTYRCVESEGKCRSSRPATKRSENTTAGSFHCREPGRRHQAWQDPLLGGSVQALASVSFDPVRRAGIPCRWRRRLTASGVRPSNSAFCASGRAPSSLSSAAVQRCC